MVIARKSDVVFVVNESPTSSSVHQRPSSQSGSLKLACADFAFPLVPHTVALNLISQLEFQGVDIGFFEGRSHVQPSEALASLDASARELKSMCEDRGLAIAELFLIPGLDLTDLSPNHPDIIVRRKSRDIFKASVAFARACGAERLTSIPGMQWPNENPSQSFARCVEEMTWRCEHAASEGIPFCIEAHVGSIVERPAQVLALIQEVPNLRLAYDPGQFVFQGIDATELTPLLPYVTHVHARGACKGNIQAVAAENTIDYSLLITALQQLGYVGWVCSEYVWSAQGDCNRVDNLSETILLRNVLRANEMYD